MAGRYLLGSFLFLVSLVLKGLMGKSGFAVRGGVMSMPAFFSTGRADVDVLGLLGVATLLGAAVVMDSIRTLALFCWKFGHELIAAKSDAMYALLRTFDVDHRRFLRSAAIFGILALAWLSWWSMIVHHVV